MTADVAEPVSELLPSSMRVNVLAAAGVMHVEQRSVPAPGTGEVLVRIGSVGICGSDVHYYRHGRIAEYVVRQPLILGHEAGGTIAGKPQLIRIERN